MCHSHIRYLYTFALLSALNSPAAYANSPCADLIPSSPKEQSVSTTLKEQSSSTPKEQGAPTHFGLGSESTSHGKDTLLLSAPIRDTFGFSSSSKTPAEQTKDFESYIGALLEHQIIGDPQLIRFIESLEKGKLINPISEEEAQVSTASTIQRKGLQNHLDKASLNHEELLNWAKTTLEKRAHTRVSREEVQKETQDPDQNLEFHPVKRPVTFEMRDGEDKKIVTLTYSTEVQFTPVTQKHWAEIMGENPSYFTKGEDSVALDFHGKNIELQPDHPVEMVTWWSILEFANRLSEKHGLPPTYDLSDITWEPGSRAENGTLRPVSGQRQSDTVRVYAKGKSHNPYKGDIYYQVEGYRLPTEAEQKYMLQGGESIKGDSLFKDESDFQNFAWYRDNSGNKTHPVGLLQPIVIDGKNFYDLYGNVRERGWDNWGLELQGGKNPVNLMTDTFRRFSGGGWEDSFSHANNNSIKHGRSYGAHWSESPEIGFRLVRTIEQSEGEQRDDE